MIVWADLRARLAPPAEAEAARVEAGRVLEEARNRCGARGASSARLSAAEHYDRGRSFLREGKIQAAAQEFQRTLAERPLDFWPNFYQGLCAYRLGKYPDAYAAFGIGAALAPGSAECFFNRALAAEAMGRVDQARSDYRAALDRDGNLTAAWLNRGILAYKLGRHPEAVADFQRALETSADTRTMGRIHYNRALARLAQGDRAAALADAEQALARGCDEARDLRQRLRPESQQHQDLLQVDDRRAPRPILRPRTDLASHRP
jgi:tetratricopeptide (TPR) repeat protein